MVMYVVIHLDASALVALTLPTSLVVISDYACNGCSALLAVTIPT